MDVEARTKKSDGKSVAMLRTLPVLLGISLILLMASPVFADILWISPAGVTALQSSGLLKPRPDGKGFYARGRIIIQRDAADQPTLRSPFKYFMFEPYKGPNNAYGPARQLEWAWVSSTQQEIDTIDDLRAILSNRDKQFGNWEAAFKHLMAEIDPNDTIYQSRLKGGRGPQTANSGTLLREGHLSRDLINGRPPTLAEMKAYGEKQRARPVGDPLGYSPIDPLYSPSLLDPRGAITTLVEAIARAEKYGEPEKGFLDAARRVARYICEDLYPPPESLSSPSRDKAIFILSIVSNARGSLFGLASGGDPNRLSDRLSRPGKFGNSLNDKLLFTRGYLQVDDSLAINVLEAAKAAVEVMGDLRTRHEQDEGTLVSTLLHVASGRAGFQSLRGQTDFDAGFHASRLPAEVKPSEDSLGQLAFDTIIALAAPPRDQGQFANQITEDLASPDSGVKAAVREAVIRASIGKVADVARLIDSYWGIGLSAMSAMESKVDGALPISVVASDVLKRAGPAIKDPTLRTLYQQYLAKKIEQFRRRQEVGSGSTSERHWLDLLSK